jgi:hypothetical protein
MSELEIKKRELDDKMTAIADGIRELSGDNALKGLDDMAQGAQTANAEIADQEKLLAQVAVALENKVSGYERGKKEGFAEALAKRTDLVATENGEYTPTEDNIGFKSVSVAVSERKLNEILKGTITEVTEEDMQGVKMIRQYQFYQLKSLEKVAIPNGVEQLGYSAFGYCENLKELYIPKSVYAGNNCVCMGCASLEKVIFDEECKMSTLGQQFFTNCTFESITIPKSLAYIYGNSLSNCKNLTTITMRRPKPPTLGNAGAFSGCPITQIIVPIGSGEAYKNATNWSEFADKIIEGDV